MLDPTDLLVFEELTGSLPAINRNAVAPPPSAQAFHHNPVPAAKRLRRWNDAVGNPVNVHGLLVIKKSDFKASKPAENRMRACGDRMKYI